MASVEPAPTDTAATSIPEPQPIPDEHVIDPDADKSDTSMEMDEETPEMMTQAGDIDPTQMESVAVESDTDVEGAPAANDEGKRVKVGHEYRPCLTRRCTSFVINHGSTAELDIVKGFTMIPKISH